MSSLRFNNGPTNAHAQPAAPEPAREDDLLRRVVQATQQERHSLEEVRYMAQAAQRSGMYNLSDSQAFVLMMLAESEGLHPMQALRRFHIIEGRPSMRADAMQAEFQRHGGRIRWVERTAVACEAEFSHPAYHPDPLTVRITLDDLINNGVAVGKFDERTRERKLKDNYRKFPRSMLSARVISEGVRAIDPGVVVGIYTPEEVQDMAPDRGATPEPDVARDPVRAAIDAAKGASPERRRVDEAVAAIRREEIEAAQAAPRTGFGQWLDAFLADAYGRWAEVARDHDADPGKPMTRFQVANHVVNAWIAEGTMAEGDIETAGKRDRNKVALAISTAWDDDPDDLRSLIEGYVRSDISRRCESAGIAPAGDGPADAPEPSDADESQGLADEDPAE